MVAKAAAVPRQAAAGRTVCREIPADSQRPAADLTMSNGPDESAE